MRRTAGTSLFWKCAGQPSWEAFPRGNHAAQPEIQSAATLQSTGAPPKNSLRRLPESGMEVPSAGGRPRSVGGLAVVTPSPGTFLSLRLEVLEWNSQRSRPQSACSRADGQPKGQTRSDGEADVHRVNSAMPAFLISHTLLSLCWPLETSPSAQSSSKTALLRRSRRRFASLLEMLFTSTYPERCLSLRGSLHGSCRGDQRYRPQGWWVGGGPA